MESTRKTLQKILTNNLMLKIVAFVIASIVWLAVININDPTKIVTISNIPISIINEEVITSNNQVYTVSSKQYVDVTISGRRSVIEDLSASSFVAEASMEELSVTNSIPVSVSVKNKSIANKVTISKQSVSQIMLDIEKIVEKSYAVEASTTGAVDKNYELGEVELGKNVVGISAPESVHERIDSVVVKVNVDGATADFSDKYKVLLLDKDGKQINKNDNIVLSNNRIQATVRVYKLKTVPIVVETVGNPADGYEIESIETNPEEITLAGPASIINEIEEIKISGQDVDITGLTTDVEKTVNLIDYLVSGVYIRGEAEVQLSIKVEGYINKKFTIEASDIGLEELPPEYAAEIISKDIEITLSGKEKDFEGVSESDLKVSVNLKNAKEGRQNIEITVEIPDGLELVKANKVKVKIAKKES